MNKAVLKMLDTTVGRLVFALLGGGAYFAIILRIVKRFSANGSGMIAYIFSPAIICGMAIVLIKLLKNAKDAEDKSAADGAILKLFWLHAALTLMAVVSLIAF